MSPKIDGKKLRTLREQRFLTQPQLANKAGVTPETISNLENENRGARTSTVLAIAQALDVHPAEFLKGSAPLGVARRFPDQMKALLTA